MVTLSRPGSRYYVEQIKKRLLPGPLLGQGQEKENSHEENHNFREHLAVHRCAPDPSARSMFQLRFARRLQLRSLRDDEWRGSLCYGGANDIRWQR